MIAVSETEDVDFKEDARSIVFVLHSPVPVRWQIEMYGVNSQEKHLFVVSTCSFITVSFSLGVVLLPSPATAACILQRRCAMLIIFICNSQRWELGGGGGVE